MRRIAEAPPPIPGQAFESTIQTVTEKNAMQIRERFIRGCSLLFGYLCLIMALAVAGEVICRKIFGLSLQGANELSGYIMASISCVAAAVAVPGRNHIRIDILHFRLPLKLQALFNCLAALSLAALGCLLSLMAANVLRDSFELGSTAATPWATPLIYPQGAWNAAMLLFTSVAVFYGFKALLLLLKGDTAALVADYQPRAAKQEAREESKEAREREEARAREHSPRAPGTP